MAVLQARQSSGRITQAELQRILRIRVPVIVKLAERKYNVGDVLRIHQGSILEFSKNSDEPMELMINNKTIAVGEAVKVGENFGIKVQQVGDVQTIIKSLGR